MFPVVSVAGAAQQNVINVRYWVAVIDKCILWRLSTKARDRSKAVNPYHSRAFS